MTDDTPEPEQAATTAQPRQLNREEENPNPVDPANAGSATGPAQPGPTGLEPNSRETDIASGQPVEPEIRETDIASAQPVVALEPLTPPKHKQRFQNRALKYIFLLIIFVTVMTMATSIGVTLIPDDEVKQTVASLASDIAKSAIPTLIALLGTATAWAFSQDSEKDQ